MSHFEAAGCSKMPRFQRRYHAILSGDFIFLNMGPSFSHVIALGIIFLDEKLLNVKTMVTFSWAVKIPFFFLLYAMVFQS